jgi:hypothetical protein
LALCIIIIVIIIMTEIASISAAVCNCSRLRRVLMWTYASDSFRRKFYSQIEFQSALDL